MVGRICLTYFDVYFLKMSTFYIFDENFLIYLILNYKKSEMSGISQRPVLTHSTIFIYLIFLSKIIYIEMEIFSFLYI